MLVRKLFGNGYYCSCCHDEWERTEWQEDISPEEFINIIYGIRDNKQDYFLGMWCENDGNLMFGCSVEWSKYHEDWFLEKSGGKKLKIFTWSKERNSKQISLPLEEMPTKEEALKWLVS